MRILVFGDSIGQGFWDTKDGGWVERIKREYDRRFVDAGRKGEPYTVFNLSISGDTTNEVLARFENEVKARTWHGEEFLIILAVGTNDARIEGEIALLERDRYAENLKTLIGKAKLFAGQNRIMLAGIPACDEALTTPVGWRDVSYVNARLEQFEQTASSVAVAEGVSFVPLFNSFRLRTSQGEQLLEDGLHPNVAGHELIYDQIKPALDRLLPKV